MKRGIVLLALCALGCDENATGDGFVAVLKDAQGLRGGAPVYVAGVQVGRVRNVVLQDNQARVEFAISSDSGVALKSDACVGVGRYGVGSDAHLTLEPGSGQPLAVGGTVDCVKSSAVGESTEQAMKALNTVLESAATGRGTIGRLLRDEELADKVERFFAATPPAADAGVDGAATVAPVDTAKPPPPAVKPPQVKPPPLKPPPKPDIIDPFRQ